MRISAWISDVCSSDLAELDAEAAALDHAIPTTEINEKARLLFAHDVARAVPPPPRGVDVEGLRILLRKVPVAEHDRAAGDQQLAFPAAGGNHSSVRVPDQGVVAGAHAAVRQGPPFLPDAGIIRLEECADVGFRWLLSM